MAMAVVRILVPPRRLAPTDRATPSSANARVKLVMRASMTLVFASARMVRVVSVSVAPRVFARSLICGSMVSRALVVRLVRMGVISSACPMIMARGVNSMSSEPRGPDEDSRRYRIKPSATVGMPMRALNMLFTSCFAGKFLRAMVVPRGRLHRVASRVAVADMWMLLRVISNISDTVGYLTRIVLGGRSSIVGGTRSR